MSKTNDVAEQASLLLTELTEMLSKAEKKFTSRPLFCTGAFQWCYDSDGPDERPEFGAYPGDEIYAHWLGVQKIDSEWRLAWSETPEHRLEPRTWVPLSSAPLRYRIRAIESLPKMEELMVQENIRMNDRIANANERLRGILS